MVSGYLVPEETVIDHLNSTEDMSGIALFANCYQTVGKPNGLKD